MDAQSTSQPQMVAGDAGQPWYASLPEQLRADPSVQKFKSVDDLAAGYVGLQKLLGHPREKLAVIPDDPAERSQLAAKLWGYPDDPASYSVPVPETVPAELRDPSKAPGLAWFSGVAKELKLPPSVAGELYSRYVDFAAKTAADQEAARSAEAAKQVEAIRQAWGENFERNAAAANQALSAIDRLLEANGHKGPKLVEVLDRAGLSSDPTVVNAMLALSRVFKEDTVAGTVKPQSMAAVDRANELLKRSISMMNDNPEEARRLAKEAAELRLLSQRA